MRVIGTVGLPGSGKGEAATVAREEGVPVVTMGDVIRRECRDRGLDPAQHHGEIAKALREENGPDAIAARSLPLIEEYRKTNETVLVDGLRSNIEVERFEEAFGDEFSLVSIEAPFELRRERVTDRGRDLGEDDGGEGLRARDERELGFGMGEAMERADVRIENTGSLESFRKQIRGIIRGGTESGEKGDADDAAAASEEVSR
ncbi:AAA family ATPase [Haloprofundus salilacus]|uniref:AAA family ATPase n=1 Tax=Haloprofundus salilacus TaxID=2876190 RepID=UPI001CCA8E34|nr:AAA family ATPase [Haloprofundus salilacus]